MLSAITYVAFLGIMVGIALALFYAVKTMKLI